MRPDVSPTVLHYVGYEHDRGGILSVVRALSQAGTFHSVLGVSPAFKQRREPMLATLPLPEIEPEVIRIGTLWRARGVARAARAWLAEDPGRIFHGHSRAGLLVALWLARSGENRVLASIHCYGAQRWFYRWAARRLGRRLFWLSPAMKTHYGFVANWIQCVPECSPETEPMAVRTKTFSGLALAGVGTLVRWKRWDLVLDALAGLPAHLRQKIRFRHVGGDDGSPASRRYVEELRSRTAAAGLADIVEWRGDQPSALPLLAESDALVVASENEPFSVALLEALQAGLPVIAADSGGTVDVIKPPVNGWLFRSGDAQDLARVIQPLVEIHPFPRVAIDRAELARFSAPVVADQWAKIYRELLG